MEASLPARGIIPRHQIQDLQISVGNRRAHYLKAGRGAPLVLVHGAASDRHSWTPIIKRLARTHTVYAPDVLGFGQNKGHDDGYYLADFTDFTTGFINALGLQPAALIGHSLGGRVCLDVALKAPQLAPKLVVVDTMGFGKIGKIGYFLGALSHGLRRFLRLPQPYPKFLHRETEDWHWRCLDSLKGLKSQTLIVWQQYDPFFPLGHALHAKRMIPEALLEVVPGFGHAPHTANPAFFCQVLLDFLDS